MLLRLTDLLIVDGLGLDPETRFGGAVHFFVYDTTKILLLLGGIIFIVMVITNGLRVILQSAIWRKGPPFLVP